MPTPSLSSCRACGGLVPPARTACPHCDAPFAPRRFAAITRALVTAAGGGALAMSLMACYGGPMHQMPPASAPTACEDYDGDGACTPADCNDQNLAIYPGALDYADDGVDQDCDGVDGVRSPTERAVDPPPASATP
jgi:hypothetical protein